MATTESGTVGKQSQTNSSIQRRCIRITLAILTILLLPAAVTVQRPQAQPRLLAVSAPARRSTRAASQKPTVRTHIATRKTNASPSTKARVVRNYGKLPLSFEANYGQTAHQVRFLSRGPGYTVFLTKNAAVLELRKPSSGEQGLGTGHPSSAAWNDHTQPMTLLRGPAAVGPEPEPSPQARNATTSTGAVMRMRLIGADPTVRIVGAKELPGKSNYLIGNNPKKWRTDVPTYARVRYQSLYPGVDLVYYGNQRQLEYDFAVAPGADPTTIRLGIDARNSKVEIAKNGDLVIRLGKDEVRFRKPTFYQPKESAATPGNSEFTIQNSEFLSGHYVLTGGNQIYFEVPNYDNTRPLIIDPVLAYSTYLGGTGGGEDGASGIATDSSGSVYVAGRTNSDDFPTTTGAYQETFVGSTCRYVVPGQIGIVVVVTYNCTDAFITKLNPLGTAIVYSTYIGGTSGDGATGIAVDSAGSAYVIGTTGSTDFPTLNAIQVTNPGASAFVAKLNVAGSGLVYSTFLGGSRPGSANAIAVDSAGSAYITGQTFSTDFPTTTGSLQPTFPDYTLCTLPSGVNSCLGNQLGCAHTFAVKIDPAGSAFDYSTYLGGGCDTDRGSGIAVDSSGNAYIAGQASPAGTSIGPGGDFPTTAGSYQPAFASAPCTGGFPCEDAFVAKLNANGSALVYSTLLGGTAADYAYAVALDSSDNAYVTGGTTSTDFPTLNGFQAALNGLSDTFVTKLNTDGSALDYSTYVGGSEGEAGLTITVDAFGSAYIAGGTNSTDFPVMNATQVAPGGGLNDAFIAKLNAAGNALDFSTYLGGSGIESATAISLDAFGNAYVTGSAGIGNFPITPGALQAQGPSTANCVNWPTGYVPFTQITSQVPGLVVGETTVAAFQELSTIPLPTFDGEGFCTPAELAPGRPFFDAADPTAAMRNGDFSGFYPITNPYTGQPFAGNIIPPSMLGSVFAWPVYGLHPPSDPYVVKISGFPASGPVVILNPNSVDFGSAVVTSSSSTQTVTLSNSGGSTLTITDISITGADSGDFSQSNTCGTSLATGSDCTISLTFTPTAAGSRGAMLSISDNAPSSPQMAALSGKGQDFALTARTTSRTAVAGTDAIYDLLISPLAGFNKSVNLSCSGAPSNSTCTVAPASVTLDGTNDAPFKLTVSTSGSALAPPGDPGIYVPPAGPLPPAAWLALISLLGLFVMGRYIPMGPRVRRLAPFAALALLLTLWAACGGGKSSSSSGLTPAGSYSLTVTATSGSLTHTSKVTLKVQ